MGKKDKGIKSTFDRLIERAEKKSLQIIESIEEKVADFKESRYMNIHDRLLRKFHKKLGLPKNATQEEINRRTIRYVQNTQPQNRTDLYEVILNDAQCSDKNFLLELFKANPFMAIIRNPGEEHQSDVEFMLEYLKVKMSGYQEMFKSGNLSSLEHTISTDHKFTDLLRNPAFIQRLAEEFPQENIVKLIDKSRYDFYAFMQDKKVGQVYSQLPEEFFQTQVGQFGKEVLRYLPQKMSQHTELVARGIQHDGFSSLEYLNIDSVLDNRKLVMLATVHDGAPALRHYIRHTLSPNRVNSYMCHGEPHTDYFYDRRYEKVQEELLADPMIRQVLEQLKEQEELAKTLEEKC